MMGPMQQAGAEILYAEHQRQMAWINEHDWKIETPRWRSLRVALAKSLMALARRVAPPQPEMERSMDALAR